MAKVVLCLVLAVTMVVAAHARRIPNPDDAGVRYQTSNLPGRLVSSEPYGSSYGSTEVLQGDNYQSLAYDEPPKGYEYDRMQEDTSTMTNSFSDSFATDTFPSSFPSDASFSTETNFVNPSQGVSYNYAADNTNKGYDEGMSRRSAGFGATGGGAGQGASFTLEGNTEKTDSVVWTESSEP